MDNTVCVRVEGKRDFRFFARWFRYHSSMRRRNFSACFSWGSVMCDLR